MSDQSPKVVDVPDERADEMLELVEQYHRFKDQEADAKASKAIVVAKLTRLLELLGPDMPEYGAPVLVDGREVAVVKNSPRQVNHRRAELWAAEHQDEAQPFIEWASKVNTRALIESGVADEYDLLNRVGYYFA